MGIAHAGFGLLIVKGEPLGRVRFDLEEEADRGVTSTTGSIAGNPEHLSRAFDVVEVQLQREDNGFTMHLVVIDVIQEGISNITVIGAPNGPT